METCCSTSVLSDERERARIKDNIVSRRKRREGLLPPWLRGWWAKTKAWAWFLIEELLEEFQPWIKWIVFDALLTLAVGLLVKRFEGLQPLFEAIGWL